MLKTMMAGEDDGGPARPILAPVFPENPPVNTNNPQQAYVPTLGTGVGQVPAFGTGDDPKGITDASAALAQTGAIPVGAVTQPQMTLQEQGQMINPNTGQVYGDPRANVIGANVLLPGGGKISFDDSLDGSDQFIAGNDNNITIDGDNIIKLRADHTIEFQDTSNNAQVTVNPVAGHITASGDISSSGTVTANALSVNGGAGTDDFFLIRSSSFDAIKTNSEGVMVLGAFTFTPTARAGGFYYDNSDDEFYLGKSN